MVKQDNMTWIILFFLAYVAFCSKVFITQLALDDAILDFLKYFYSLIFLCCFIYALTRLDSKEVVFYIIIFVFFIYTYLQSKTTAGYSILALSYFAVICKRLNSKETAGIVLLGNIFNILLVLPFTFFTEYPLYAPDEVYGIRATFGFYNPNIAAMLILTICMSVCWFLKERSRGRITFLTLSTLIIICGFFLIEMTKSRTSAALLLILLAGVISSTLYPRAAFRRLFFLSITLLVVGIIFFQFHSIKNYDPSVPDLNVLLSGRLSLGNTLYVNMGTPDLLYGIDIDSFTPIDFFYVAYFYTNGILLSMLTIYLIIRRIQRIKFDFLEMSIIVITILTTLTERQILSPHCCLLVYIIYSQRNDELLNKDS